MLVALSGNNRDITRSLSHESNLTTEPSECATKAMP